MTMITPSYLGETIEYSSLHACRSTLEDPTYNEPQIERFILAVSGPHFESCPEQRVRHSRRHDFSNHMIG